MLDFITQQHFSLPVWKKKFHWRMDSMFFCELSFQIFSSCLASGRPVYENLFLILEGFIIWIKIKKNLLLMAKIFWRASSKRLFLIQCFQTYHNSHITPTPSIGLNGWEYILSIFITINYLKGTSNKQNSTEMESTQFIYSVQSNNIYYVRNI